MNDKPEKIVSRDLIVKQQAEKTQQALAEATKRINARLKAADKLPVLLLPDDLGPTEWVRAEVFNWLRDAGWKWTEIRDEAKTGNKIAGYQVQ